MSPSTSEGPGALGRAASPARSVSLEEVHGVFTSLAADVEHRWDRTGGDDAFARAATAALAEAMLPERLPVEATLTYLAAWPGLPPVVAGENEYGEPTVTVWRSDDFHVEVIVWQLGAIALHDHVNAGAFVALAGRRFHTRYDFEPTGTWADAFTVGRLTMRQGEVLRPGDARGIVPGTSFLHDLVFCDPRCVTVSIRRRAASGDSASYLAPGIRLPNTALRMRRTRALATLHDVDPAAWTAAVERMVAFGPDTALFALLELCPLVTPAELGPVIRRVADVWGGELPWWAQLVGEVVRRGRLERLLPFAEPEGRLALAALRSGVDGETAAALRLDAVALVDDEHETVARTRAVLRWA